MDATRRLLALQKTLATTITAVNVDSSKTSDDGNRLQRNPSHEADSSGNDILILPNGDFIKAVLLDDDNGKAEVKRQIVLIHGSHKPIGVYHILYKASSVSLSLSAVGTPFEGRAHHVPKYPMLEIGPSTTASIMSSADLWSIIYFLFVVHHAQEHLPVVISERFDNCPVLVQYLLSSGLGRTQPNATTPNVLFVSRMAFWQGAGAIGWHEKGWLLPANALTSESTARSTSAILPHHSFPYVPAFTRDELVIASHPLRPPKPQPGEALYRRYCPSVGKMLEFQYFCLDDSLGQAINHLATFHRWHNNPRVNAGWGEGGTLVEHRAYLEKVLADPAVLPVMMSWDGELMGYIEIVWVKENHMATYIGGAEGGEQARDWDRALHVLVGEDRFKGKAFSSAWLRSAVHYAFLAEPRTERVLGEPRADNMAILEACMNAGFHLQTVFDFPHKRSALVITTRERFFKFDLL
ncbi:hypothetical protein HGRIS_005626 [Hohenbuehelia grisea]|uniref:Acyltransferase MbtK/IucB-like conserved domain-containing protein n=1 Tax=Hohenbuehelia grisea TaxID=104357 RepID=A0ABR3JZ89_9AGAR